jgi:uncharacterized protein YdeI (YjbR/CyaY-like superfamily)
MKISESLHAKSRAEWRTWLERNHNTQSEIWLVFFRKKSGEKQVSYEEAVEEALCFGWIDSIIQNVDDEKYARKALNKRRIAQMIREGKMTESGLAVLNFINTDDDYGRTKERAQHDLIPPPFLECALKTNRRAWENFRSLAPSYRRNYIRWISAAKTEETRDRRLREAISLLVKNEKLGMK